MKKFVLAVLCFMMSTCVFAQSPIDFAVRIIDKMPMGNGQPKSPMRPPVVYIEDHTLAFVADHPEYILNIKDEDGEVVYTTTVFSTQTQVVLPSILSGDYEVNLVMGNWLFVGWINLY
jgi:hypothetical protein